MSKIETVVLVGATGILGTHILSALRSSPFKVTILTRTGSSTASSPALKDSSIITADYDSRSSLASALKGIDAVISAVGASGLAAQIPLIDACIDAGVRRFIPSEFGCDTFNEKCRQLPVYKMKVAVTEHLMQKAKEGKIEWTAIIGGPFLDMGIAKGFLGFNFADKKATLYDSGTHPFSTTTLPDLARAVIGVLTHPGPTSNRPIYVHTARISQTQLQSVLERAMGTTLEPVLISTVDLEKKGTEMIRAGDMSGMRNFILRAIFGGVYGTDFKGRLANELVGVRELDSAGLEDLAKRILKT